MKIKWSAVFLWCWTGRQSDGAIGGKFLFADHSQTGLTIRCRLLQRNCRRTFVFCRAMWIPLDGTMKNQELILGKSNKEISIIDKGLEMEGRIFSSGSIIVKGRIKGSIDGDTVIIAEGGVVQADARVKNMTIDGRFVGDMVVTDKLVILSKGRCAGSVTCKTLVVEAGGGLNAQVSYLSSGGKGEKPEPKAIDGKPHAKGALPPGTAQSSSQANRQTNGK
jgi:cytoskeletal protein CcmA (bactofilin family)